jgi:hypothetical protein
MGGSAAVLSQITWPESFKSDHERSSETPGKRNRLSTVKLAAAALHPLRTGQPPKSKARRKPIHPIGLTEKQSTASALPNPASNAASTVRPSTHFQKSNRSALHSVSIGALLEIIAKSLLHSNFR